MLGSPLVLLVLIVLVRSGLPVIPVLPVLVPVLAVLTVVVLAVLAVLVLVDRSLLVEAVCALNGPGPTRVSSTSVVSMKHASKLHARTACRVNGRFRAAHRAAWPTDGADSR